MVDTLTWGILSTARINRRVIPAISTSPRSQLVGVASRRPEKARAFAHLWKIPRVFNSYEALLASPHINTVYIPLPNSLHRDWVIKAARSGKHVFCEKPLAVSVKQVDEMKRAADENGVVLLEGLAYRMHPQYAKLQELIAAGTIGAVKYVRAHYFIPLPEGCENIRWHQELGGGCLWDIGCYPVSFTRGVVGAEPQRVFGQRVRGFNGVDILFAGQVMFPDCVIGQISCGFCLPFRTGAEVVGDKSRIVVPNPWQPDVDGKRSGLIHISPDDHEILIKTEVVDPYLCEIRVMERAVLKGVFPSNLLDESRRTVAAVSALSRSADTGQEVRMRAKSRKKE